jgi:Leucine-rich repeat (LRR) protein
MIKDKVTDRLAYLAELFDIFECDDEQQTKDKIISLEEEGYGVTPVTLKVSSELIGLISIKVNEKGRETKKISVCASVFGSMLNSDPTENKIYLQWMLTLFSRLLKEPETYDVAVRLVEEDLPQALNYLALFEENKRKKKFKTLCKGNYSLVGISDPTNINQYKSLSQLFDSVDPFIERDASSIERTMKRYVDIGEAVIPVRDRNFTVYIPKSTEASVIFGDFANWCTARPGNGMFNSYISNKKPNGENSNIYIIIDNDFFNGTSKNLYQIHFESSQVKDSRNASNVSLYSEVLEKSDALKNFFYEELMGMAKTNSTSIEDNIYFKHLVKFGFAESLFELVSDDISLVKFTTMEIPKLPNISRFKNVDQFIITNASLRELHPSIGDLLKLELLSLPNNKINVLPKEIGKLLNLRFLNLNGNKNITIPDEIAKLDRSNGGSLDRLSIGLDDIGEINYKRLKELLPTTTIS